MKAINPALPGRLSQSYAILEMIAISGELPADLVQRLVSRESYRERLQYELKQNKMTRVFQKDKLRGLRLTTRAKELLLADNQERFSFYLTGNVESNQPKGAYKRRLRLHRLAETYVIMRNAGVAIFRDDKPDIFSSVSVKQAQIISKPCFYSSREIKEAGQECVKIRGSRMAGVLLSCNATYVVYNTGSSLMKWDYNSETRTKILLQTLIQHNQSRSNIHGLMIGADMQVARQLLTCAGGMNSNYLVIGRDVNKFLYVPNCIEGELLIRLICDADKRTLLNSRLSDGYNAPHPGMRIENDALDNDGNPILFAYDFDMPRIVRFNTALQLYCVSGTLICFDFQADVLRNYCCENAHIRTIDFSSFQRRFFP